MPEIKILTKEFSLAEVLGVISGYLLVDRGFDRLHDLMEWMSGGCFTHQVPTIGPMCATSLKRQFPQLDVDASLYLSAAIRNLVCALKIDDKETEEEIWCRLKEEHGDSFHVAPLRPFDGDLPGLLDGLDKGKTIVIHGQSDEFPEYI